MRWVGHVARTGAMRNAYKILFGKPKGRDHLGDLGIYWLKCILKSWLDCC